jgi:hypothetical protein
MSCSHILKIGNANLAYRLGGVAIVALSGLAPLVLPVTAVRTLAVTENLCKFITTTFNFPQETTY